MPRAGTPTARRGRIALLSLVALGAIAGIGATSASAANPTILNTGTGCTGQTQWLLTCATGGEGGPDGNADFVRLSGWVNHDLAVSGLASILTDDDWDGTVDATTVRAANAQRPTIFGGYPRSRFNVSYEGPNSNTGMSCSFGTGTRRTDNRNARIAARDSAAQTSGTSSSQIKFVAAGGCTGPEDYAYIDNVAASNFGNTLTPGQSDTFTYQGDDSDSTGNSDFNGVFWRLRNIRTGATTAAQLDCDNNGDSTNKSTTVTFPDRGAWVVEAELRTGSGCGQQQNNTYWFALGSADVNSTAAPTGALAADGDTVAAGIQRPQFNGTVQAQASSLSDTDSGDGGGVQIIEWDLDENTGNGVDGYEDTSIGGYGATISGAGKNINTTGQAPGLHTVRMRLTDNGAGDAADAIRRRSNAISTTYLVDSAPTANAQTVATDTNVAKAITLSGSDPDGDSLTYSIVTPPANGSVSGGTGAARTYTPNTGFAGTDSFVFQVNDGFGRTANATVTVQVSPNTAIDTPPVDPSNQRDGTIPFSSNATGATFECALDTTTFTACPGPSPYSYSNLSDGSHTFRVRATAGGFTDQTPAETTWTIDATPPDTQIDPPTPANPTNQTNATFNFSAPGEPSATFECRLDGDMPAGTGWQVCTNPKTYAGPLTHGSHTFEVRAVDALQNKDQSPASFTWVIDTVAPNVTIDPPTPPDPSNSPSATFNFSSDGSGNFACRLDTPAGPGTFQPCGSGTSSTQTYNSLTDGSHTFRVRQTDAASNTSTEATHTWVVDLTPPTVTLQTFPNSSTNQNTASFTYTASETGVTFQCKLDTPAGPGTYQPCNTQPQTYSGLADGQHTFHVKGTDVANNEGPATDYTWTIDQTPPDTTILTNPPNPSNMTTASFTYESTEPAGATFQCRLDTGPFLPCNGQPHTRSSLSQGSHTFYVQATDAAGNTDPTPASYTWVVDTTPPATAIDDNTAPGFDRPPTHRTTSNNADFDFFSGSSDPNATFKCRLDSTLEADFAPCSPIKSYTNLVDGPHRFEVRATDQAGNTDPSPAVWNWEIYSGLPNTTIDVFPDNPTNSTSAHFEYTSSIPDSTFTCALDTSAPAPCSSPDDFTNLDPGPHTFTVFATDEFGRDDPSPASYTWTIDLTDPDTTITANPDDPTNLDDASFQFTSTEMGSTFECRLDGEVIDGGTGWVACGDPVLQQDYTDLPDGEHTFDVRATDAAGNVDETPEAYTWTIDTDDPETTIDNQPSDPSNVIDPEFAFSSDESPDVTFQCKLDTPAGLGTFQPCDSPEGYTNLGEGSHTFSVYAIDAAGNVDDTPDTYTWDVDLTAPDTTIDPPTPADPTNDTTPEFNFSSEAGATFECSLDSTDPVDFEPCDSGDTVTVTEGTHTFYVQATDIAGNTDATPDSHTWTVDITDPTTTITAGPDDPTNITSASFSFTSDASPATFECRIDSTDDNDWQSCVSGQTYPGLTPNTTHTFEVRATDESGNTDDTPASFNWDIDTDEPETSITPPVPANPTNLTSASFNYTSDESPASFECRLDSTMESDFQPCNTQPQNYTNLGPGPHTFEVRAIDDAGNKDSTPAGHTWVIDTSPPETTIDPPTPDDPTNGDDPAFNFSSEAGATFECRLDGDPPLGTGWQSCTSGQSYTDVDPGEHTFEVRATDTAGNTDQTPASFAWEIDQDEPETEITSGPDNPTSSLSATFEFTSDEPDGDTFECSVDGGSFADCDPGDTFTVTGEGPHFFDVQATDDAGNTDSSPDRYDWVVDQTGPTATIDPPTPPNPSDSSSASFNFSSEAGATFECRLDGDPPAGTGWGTCTNPQPYSSLTEDSHTFEVRATDAADNTGAPADYTWVVDTIAPTVDITSGPDDPTNSTSASIAFNTGGSPATIECDLNGTGFSACTSAQTYSSLTERSHTVTVKVTDAAGNSATDDYTWVVDLTAPAATITSQPPAQSNSASASFGLSSEAGATFECRLDGDPPSGTGWGTCTDPKPYSSLTEGSHTFEVRATDAANNTGTPDDYTWNVDTIAPAPAITGGPTGTTNQNSATFTYDPGGTGLTEECQLDGGGFTPCTSPKTYTGLGDGPHTFIVRVTDAATNSGTATRTWTVDAGLPDTTITGGPNATTSATDANMAFTSSENGSTFECKLDSGAFVGCTSPQPYTGLAVGNHTFEVRATDAVGNVDPSPATRSWTVTAAGSGAVLGAGPPIIKKRLRALNVPTEAAFQIATITCRAGNCTITEKTAKFKIGGRTYQGSISIEVVAKSSVDSLTKGEVAQAIVHFPLEVRRSLVANHTGVLSVRLAAQTDAGNATASKRIKIKAKFLKKLFG